MPTAVSAVNDKLVFVCKLYAFLPLLLNGLDNP